MLFKSKIDPELIMTTNDLSNIANKLSILANENLTLLEGRCQDTIEIQDYYIGILRKQALLLSDLSLILQNRNSENISTPFILLRSLLDDFLHLLYLETHNDRKTEITKINAEAFKYNFNSLIDLTNSNYKHFSGKYPFYMTNEQLQAIKNKFKAKEINKKYLKNPAEFKFKAFKSFGDMVKSISHSREVDIFKDRAYFLWKHFSSFVHYSNSSFEYELQDAKENMNMIDESFQYCYNSIYLSFKYFERELKIEFKDNTDFRKEYGIILEC